MAMIGGAAGRSGLGIAKGKTRSSTISAIGVSRSSAFTRD